MVVVVMVLLLLLLLLVVVVVGSMFKYLSPQHSTVNTHLSHFNSEYGLH